MDNVTQIETQKTKKTPKAKKAKKETKKTEQRKGRIVQKEITVALSAQELAKKSQEENELTIRRKDKKAEFTEKFDEFKKVRAEWKKEDANLEENLNQVSMEIKNKASTQMRECLMVMNFEANLVEYWYPATGKNQEIADTRPMEENDRQAVMFEQAENAEDTGEKIFE